MITILILVCIIVLAVQELRIWKEMDRHEQAICELLLKHPELLEEEEDE